MTMSAYDQKTLREVVAGTKSMTYDEERSGGSLIFGRPVFDRKLTRASATVRLDHISGSSSTVDPQLAPILLPTDVRSLGLSIVKDSRDSFLDATSGLYNSGSIEVAGFGGASFTKMEGELRRYFVVKPGRETEPDKLTIKRTFEMIPWIYASRLSLGTSFGQPPFLDQYFVGGTGANMLRGYADDRFPGKHHLIWNNELRVPLSLAVSGVAFVDVGDAWGGDYAATFGDAKMKLRAGYGVGLRVMTPIGPFRFDYAMPTTSGSKAQFHLGIGASF
jgi:outer membrane protein insertion porin family